MMLAMVTFVASLIAIYAAGYMHGDRGYWRFFSYMGLFVFSMTMLVSVSNFVLLYVFWEAVGLCSYLLIGFWYEKPEAAAAGKKAFLVNRIGDFGFALAIFLIWTTYGTLNFHDDTKLGIPGVLGQTRLASVSAEHRQTEASGGRRSGVGDQGTGVRGQGVGENDPEGLGVDAQTYRVAAGYRVPSTEYPDPRPPTPDPRPTSVAGLALRFASCSSLAHAARVPNFRCMCGCPTRWRVRHRSLR